jgi:hypothetical protein
MVASQTFAGKLSEGTPRKFIGSFFPSAMRGGHAPLEIARARVIPSGPSSVHAESTVVSLVEVRGGLELQAASAPRPKNIPNRNAYFLLSFICFTLLLDIADSRHSSNADKDFLMVWLASKWQSPKKYRG